MNSVLLYAMNLFDLLCTLYALHLGATELNHMMASVPVMVVYKLVVVGALLWWLSRRPERAAKVGLRICTAVYAALDAYHLISLIWIGGMTRGGV